MAAIRHCREYLHINLQRKDVYRAHCLGRNVAERCRPVIVKIKFHKTRESISFPGRKFKGTNYSVRDDSSRFLRTTRKHLLAFAKAKPAPFIFRYKTLVTGSKRHVSDEP